MEEVFGGRTVYFYHGKTNDGYRFTIAGRFQSLIENDPDSDDIIMFGISLCSEKDQFAKKTGRIRAEGRMKSKQSHGKSWSSLYNAAMPKSWWEGSEQKVFNERASLNSALSRAAVMRKFNL